MLLLQSLCRGVMHIMVRIHVVHVNTKAFCSTLHSKFFILSYGIHVLLWSRASRQSWWLTWKTRHWSSITFLKTNQHEPREEQTPSNFKKTSVSTSSGYAVKVYLLTSLVTFDGLPGPGHLVMESVSQYFCRNLSTHCLLTGMLTSKMTHSTDYR